jgi:hypothetical protein
MALVQATTPQTPARRVLDRLLQEKGLRSGAYALFFVVGEGTFFQPPESSVSIEEASGFVLDADGAIHSFWLEWDPVARRPIFSEWEPVEPEPTWHDEPEYQEARRRVGLRATA